MKATCTLDFHDEKPLTSVCTNPKCQNNRIFCSKCLKAFHKDCLDYVLDIEDIDRRKFSSNVAWIQDPIISQAILTIEKHKITANRDQLIEGLANILEEEFDKIVEFFMKRIKETKEKILENIKKSSGDDDLIVETFYKKLKSLYNFDSFLGILESLKHDAFDRENISKELNHFLEHINNRKEEQEELQDMAKKINSLTKSYLDLDLKQFDRFKQEIPFHLFDKYPSWIEEEKNGWGWSTEKKSSKIILCEENKSVKKVVSSENYSGILGDTEFSDGRWKWEIGMSSGGYLSKWVCFGIIEPQYTKNIESLPYSHYLGLSTRGQTYNITKVNEISVYDDKKYICELDLTHGTFTISHKGEIVCKESDSLKGKTFLPFVVLYTSGNSAKLTVLKSE